MTLNTRVIKAHVPRKLAPLINHARYKGAYGGRGSGKSHFFAEQLAIRCLREPTRAVGIREVQNSIKESVKQLLADKIAGLGLLDEFEILESEIRGRNGSLIVFRGMQSFNADNIKSLEGIDVAWVEEAQSLSDRSWRLLRPTIRKPGSEIWCSWNPRHDTDAVDAFFRGPHTPVGAVCVEVNWQDNPWFPDVLRDEMERDYRADPEMAEHVWGGGYEIVSDGAYYARLIAAAEREGRIGEFPYNPRLPVVTGWDLGVDDYTAVWFIQENGQTATVIDYYECQGEGADHVIATMFPEVFNAPPLDANYTGWDRAAALDAIKRNEPYRYGHSYLPHDIKMREWGNGARSRVQVVQELGLPNVRKGSAANPADRIQAVREVLPRVRFNNTDRVQKGIKRLRRYSRKFSEQMGMWLGPAKDGNDHGADAFGEWAINSRLREDVKQEPARPTHHVFEAGADGRIRSNMSVREIIDAKRRQRMSRLNG